MTLTIERPALEQAAPATQAQTAAELDLDARYTVAGSGIAYWLAGYATEWTEEDWVLACDDPAHVWDLCDEDDDECHGPECYLYSEPEEVEDRTKVRAVMVGDDREHIVDVDDLTEISEEDYCPGCGQIGCGAYG